MRWVPPGMAVLVAAAITTAAAGCSPAPSAPPASPPGASATAGRALGQVATRVSLGASVLLPAPDGAWYLRTPGGGSAWVGRTAAGGVVIERPAGPAPVALATDGTSLFVGEGQPDGPAQPRSRVLEALDPATLEVRRSVPVDDVIVDLVADGGRLWVLRADGVVAAYDAATLTLQGEVRTQGSGPGFLAIWGGSLWSLGVDRDAISDAVLSRVDRQSRAVSVAARFPGRFPAALSNGDGAGGWVGLGDAASVGTAVPVDASGATGTAVTIPVPSAMLVVGGELWWTSHDGRVGRLTGSTRYDSLSLGTVSDLVASGGRIWVASQDLVLITPAP